MSSHNFTIGKAQDNQIIYDEDGVSRNHLRVQIRDNQVFITDLGSQNGTLLKDLKLTPLKDYPYPNLGPICLGDRKNTILIEAINESEDSKYEATILMAEAKEKLKMAKEEYQKVLTEAQTKANQITEQANLRVNATQLKLQNMVNQRIQQAEAQSRQILGEAKQQHKLTSDQFSQKVLALKQEAIKLQNFIKEATQKSEILKKNYSQISIRAKQDQEKFLNLQKQLKENEERLKEVNEQLSDGEGLLKKHQQKFSLELDNLRTEIEIKKRAILLDIEDEKLKLEDLKNDVYETSRELIQKTEAVEKFDSQMAEINQKKEEAERIINDVEARKLRTEEDLQKITNELTKKESELEKLRVDFQKVQDNYNKRVEESSKIKEEAMLEAKEILKNSEEEKLRITQESNEILSKAENEKQRLIKESQDQIELKKEEINNYIRESEQRIQKRNEDFANYVKETEQKILNKKQEILHDAKQEFDKIITSANDESRRIIDESYQEKEKITQEANEYARSTHESLEATKNEEALIREEILRVQDKIESMNKQNEVYFQTRNQEELEKIRQHYETETEKFNQFKQEELNKLEELKRYEQEQIEASKSRELENIDQIRSQRLSEIEQEIQSKFSDMNKQIENKKMSMAEIELNETNNLNAKLQSMRQEFQKEQQNEAKRISVVLTNYIDAKFRVILDEKDRHERLDEFNDGLFKTITQIMMNENPDDIEDAKALLNFSTKGQEKVKEWYIKQGIRASFIIVPLLIILIFPNFVKSIKDSILSSLTTDKSASDLYIKNLQETKFKKIEFNPDLVDKLGNTYVDSVLYTRDYFEIISGREYQDKWIKSFTEYANEDLELSDETVVDYIAKELTLIKNLMEIRSTINPKYLKESRVRMEEIEKEFVDEITKLLKGMDNYILLYGEQQDFYNEFILEYRKSHPIPDPPKEPEVKEENEE